MIGIFIIVITFECENKLLDFMKYQKFITTLKFNQMLVGKF